MLCELQTVCKALYLVGVDRHRKCMKTQSLSSRSLLYNKKTESEVAQSCPTLCDPMGWSLPGSSVHGIFQAGILEWVAISFSRGSS